MGNEEEPPKAPRVTRFGGPGPGSYMLPPTIGYEKHDYTRLRNPAYSFGVNSPGVRKWQGPGPQYDPGMVTRYGSTKTPQYKFGIKPPPLAGFRSPGPAAYSPDKCPPAYKAPAYTMGGRSNRKFPSDSPGPNAYVLPPFKPTPNTVMGLRLKDMTRSRSPGPAAYMAAPMEIYKPKTPRVTLTGRNSISARNPGPGPGAYMSEYHAKNAPKFSFGVRHTDIQTPCITEQDNQ